MKGRLWICILAFVVLQAAAPAGGRADSVYAGYIYDAWGNSVPAPNAYLPQTVVSGEKETGRAFRSPADLFVHDEKTVYISDAGNHRVVVLDEALGFVREITAYYDKEGVKREIRNPAGLFVDREERLYVCLPDEESVVVLDGENRLIRTYGRPDTDLLEPTARYKPVKVLANQLGTVFILPRGLYLGAVMFATDGKFLGFYGANKVTATLGVIIDYQWKQLLSQKQVDSMGRYVPIQYASFDMDGENFIYTCTNDSTAANEISKLNPLGHNVLVRYLRNRTGQTGDYGDLHKGYYMGQIQDSSFVDICVHPTGIFYALDHSRGRIFVYDQESHLLSVFGGPGYQNGTFLNAAAIDTMGDRVLVLDADKGSVTVFEKTEYGRLVERAVLLYADGLYQEAREIWREVARLNVNCELAYIGIGKALYEQGDYRQAMHYFELGYDRAGYSRAYEEYRKIAARQIMPHVLTTLLVGGLAAVFLVKIKKRGRAAGKGGAGR